MKNKKGFTLVELLVVIAIIGILSTVAVVSLQNTREEAKMAAAKQNLISIRAALLECLYNDVDLNSASGHCAPPFTVWAPGDAVCNGSNTVWPTLEGDFGSYFCNVPSSNPLNFSYGAQYNPGPSGTTITCNSSGCNTP